MSRNRISPRSLGYAVTGTMLAVSLSGCGLFQGANARVAGAHDAAAVSGSRDEALFVDAGQAQSLNQLLAEARAKVDAAAELEARSAALTKKERRAAKKARDAALVSAGSETSAPDTARAALESAEAQVFAAPLEAGPRIALAKAYLANGRFESAVAGFADAEQLGASSAQVGLQHALALMGLGEMSDAVQILERHQAEIPVADLGLAFALAGSTDRGIALLSDAIRGGQTSVKIRQNLAYSYALANRWRHARVMAAQDVPANEINQRIEEWSRTAHPDAWQARIAGLLNAPANVYDRGMPLELALSNFTGDTEFVGAEALEAPAFVADELSASQDAPSEVQVAGAALPGLAPVTSSAPVAVEPVIASETGREQVLATAWAQMVETVPVFTAASEMAALSAFEAAASVGPLAAPQIAPRPASAVERAFIAQVESQPLARAPTLPVAVANLQKTGLTRPAVQPSLPAPVALAMAKAVEATPAVQASFAVPARVAPLTQVAAQSQVPPSNAAPRTEQAQRAQGQRAQDQRAQGQRTVRLGSFLSEREAQLAVETYRTRYTSLQGRNLEITEALVRGKRYFRVSATGYNLQGSRALCSEAKRAGDECLAYSAAPAMPSTVARGRRFVRA